MKKRIKKIALIATAFMFVGQSMSAADPAYYPNGPQVNVASGEVSSGGWTLCYSEDLGTPLVKATISNACTGQYILYAGKETASNSFLLLAAGERETVFTVTGNNVTNLNNGSYWYFNDSSLGFAPNGTITQNTADTSNANDPLRFSLHTSNIGGWRIGTVNGINSGGNNVVNDAPTIWTKQVWTSDGSPRKAPLVEKTSPTLTMGNNVMSCSAGSYMAGMSDVEVKSLRYQLYINDALASSVIFDQGSNLPPSTNPLNPNKVSALVSAKNAIFDVSSMNNYSAYCVVEVFGQSASLSTQTNSVQDAAFIAAANAKAQAWEDQRASATAANFTQQAREMRKRIAARSGN